MLKNQIDTQKTIHEIRVAILAEEPLGWGSGKHFFPEILNGYSWKKGNVSYKIRSEYIYDKDILKGKLDNSYFDVLLVPGGGIGDGEAVVKGFTFFPKVKKWKKKISDFIKNGGGYVGICGGAALFTDLVVDKNRKPTTFLERQYNKSSLNMSCVSSYYNYLATPLFYLFQNCHPERIGATAYVFSFAPGETKNGIKIFTGGVPIDFKINKNNPIFSDFPKNIERIRWWGGPALVLPKNLDRDVKILATYPEKEMSENGDISVEYQV